MIVPQGSVDTHAHVFEPDLPMAEGCRYVPDYAARLDDYLARLDAFGFARGVLVQPSFLGTDNRYLMQALRKSAGRCKGVAVVDPSFPPEVLDALKAGGVEGIRLNLFGRELPPLAEPAWQRLLAEVNRLDWHVEVHCPWQDLPHVMPALHDAGCRLVVDHLGRPDFSRGTDLAQLKFLCSLGQFGQTWVKLSGAYRLWGRPDQAGYSAAVDLLLSWFGPERLMWGSDWPHTQHEASTTLSDGLLLLTRSISDPDVLEQIFVRTPYSFFDF
jgi:predicted TIM-barrel fold metal-dependent hydrolase